MSSKPRVQRTPEPTLWRILQDQNRDPAEREGSPLDGNSEMARPA